MVRRLQKTHDDRTTKNEKRKMNEYTSSYNIHKITDQRASPPYILPEHDKTVQSYQIFKIFLENDRLSKQHKT